MSHEMQLKATNLQVIDRKLGERDVCYVVMKNTTILRWVDHQKTKDEVTQVLKVFMSEEKANQFSIELKPKMNESVYVIPTLFEDYESESKPD